MKVYLVRHATPENITDIDPPLGKVGIEEATMLARLFAAVKLQPESVKVVSSTAQRALQTTAHICEAVAVVDGVFICPTRDEDTHGPEFVTSRLLEQLRVIAGDEKRDEVIVVGHWPYLTKCLAWLLGNDVLSLPHNYGATTCLACDSTFQKGTAVFDWLVVPVPLPSSEGMGAAEPTLAGLPKDD